MDERWRFAGEFLADRRDKDCLRTLRVLEKADSPARVSLNGRELLNLASNDYLGLRSDTRPAAAAARAFGEYGLGAGGSRLICGTTPAHEAAEAALARFHGTGAALAFSSGYAAGVGIIPALAGRGDRVYLDRLCHACLYDGASLSGARLERFRHNDTAHLATLLERDRLLKGRALVAVDSVFSMDGDRAPVAELAGLCREHGALLLVDEAHAVGVLGPGGRGLAAGAGCPSDDALVLGTLGKAFGLAGAYVVCTPEMREYLINACRSFVFSTATPPPLAAAVACAVEIVSGMDAERERLAGMAGRLREHVRRLGFDTLGSSTQIVPAVSVTPKAALRLSDALAEAGVFAPAVRPPTVPEGTSRVRLSLTAALSEQDFELLLEALARAAGES